VAAALLLYEAYRQWVGEGMYEEAQMKKGERARLMKKWSE
jgi:hypothetical protein